MHFLYFQAHSFEMYVNYCENKPKSESFLWTYQHMGGNFFEVSLLLKMILRQQYTFAHAYMGMWLVGFVTGFTSFACWSCNLHMGVLGVVLR